MRRLPYLLFIIVSSVYFATVTGVTSSNDGSHYALTRAIAEGRGFEISPYLDFTENLDYATRDGQFYSDRPPGTGILAAPLYALGQVGPDPAAPLPSKHDAGNPHLIYALMLPPLLMAGAVTLFYVVVTRYVGVQREAALLASVGLAFGTLYWKYGSVLYSHALAAFVLWVGLLLILRAEEAETVGLGHSFALGAALGFAPLTEYTSALWSVFAGLYLLAVFVPRARRETGRWLSLAGVFTLGALVPALLLMAYNTINFGGPLEISRFYANLDLWPENENLLTSFSTPLLEGLRANLWYWEGNQGLVLLAPISVLGVLGLPAFWRRDRRRFVLIVGAFLIFLLLMSKSTTYFAGTYDSRYLTPFMGLVMVPAAVWLDERLMTRGGPGLLVVLLVGGLLALSMRNQAVHIAFSWNYDLEYASFYPQATRWENIQLVVGTLFRNVPNLPLLWLVEAAGLFILMMGQRWQVKHVD